MIVSIKIDDSKEGAKKKSIKVVPFAFDHRSPNFTWAYPISGGNCMRLKIGSDEFDVFNCQELTDAINERFGDYQYKVGFKTPTSKPKQKRAPKENSKKSK